MGDGEPSENRARCGCSADGGVEEKARSWPGASFRPGRTVHFALFLRKAQGGGHQAIDGKDRDRFGQSAMAESFVSTLKAELVSQMRFPSRQAARTAIFEYLETFYNTRRLHSSLGYRSPAEFEEDRIGEASVA